MFIFVVGLLTLAIGLVIPILLGDKMDGVIKVFFRVAAGVIALVLVVASTAIYVEDDQAGIVIVKFGKDLPVGQIIATDGEKGPQARVLPPGWHFLYWPWLYDLKTVDNMTIPQGNVGVVESMDGAKPLPKGEIFAQEWENPVDMLNAQMFMKEGHKGPQLTVLTPGQYRYNPRLFKITVKKALEVPIGTVAVIKANAGKKYDDSQKISLVNGVPIVPTGFRGIWNKALSPNAYYLHPDAFVVTLVQTTNRVYNYVQKNSITVKTSDSFEFPVDVRVSVKISAEDAPYVVAMLANPDADLDRNGFVVLEDRVILPTIRAIFRNNAESRGAIQYVQERSQIEESATATFAEKLASYRVTTDGVYVADIGIRDTEEGKKLLSTQTDKEVAKQEVDTFKVQQTAEIERAQVVKAKEDAEQEQLKAKARAKVDIAEQEAQAEIKLAEGRAQAYMKKMEALGGVDNFVKLEMLRLAMEQWDGKVPEILLMGGGDASSSEAVNSLIMKKLQADKK
ncbi:Band 7 protein [Lentisphaera araneosa HTCC2155]|uniref:Band 7 protein n=1 Tax=Lentisphaera araneosa HTCC2155 TaxID=313628 RepID=A6DPA3_9BACT|nr:SPFH domain-containing protein [Lentisphaera araneosa]EDM26635.1 Band 7 protein [Lentisphaera araneosa HTCC2155]